MASFWFSESHFLKAVMWGETEKDDTRQFPVSLFSKGLYIGIATDRHSHTHSDSHIKSD